MVVGIFTNIYKDVKLEVTKALSKALADNHIDYYIIESIKSSFPKAKFFNKTNLPQLDVMFVVGGDGTILNIVSECAHKNIPILGINLGNLGFLSEIETQELSSIISIIKEKKFFIEERSMLNITLGDKSFLALNEAVAERTGGAKVVSLDVFVDNEFIDRFICDGIIISTPTGSTAYSLSAGGPILSPKLNAFCITPICPHSLHSRPLVIGDYETVRIRPVQNSAQLNVDGAVISKLDSNQEIIINKSEFLAKFIRINKPGFYLKLLKKLNKWSVTQEDDI